VTKSKANYEDVEVSIVVPIYNGAEHLKSKIESLIDLGEVNHEIIFSLNLSSDNSEELLDCYGYLLPNAKVIKQTSLISLGENFYRGVAASRGKYIYVSAVDDLCSKNFYKDAVDHLNENINTIAFTPITKYSDNLHGGDVNFELSGKQKERIATLMHNVRVSHGIFYSMIRRKTALKLYEDFLLESNFVASDWLFDIKLALEGEVRRSTKSNCVFGVKGLSRKSSSVYSGEKQFVYRLFPYFKLARKIVRLSIRQRVEIKVTLIKIAIKLLLGNLHRFLFQILNTKVLYR
jgi:glycosyltransferase involved in cell wall biosynthesis